jgi:anti-sigma regulatory factor (Ser/Thr protein kinase)
MEVYKDLFDLSFEAQCIININEETAHINNTLQKHLNYSRNKDIRITELIPPDEYSKVLTSATDKQTEIRLTIAGHPLLCRITRKKNFLLCSCSTAQAYNEIKDIGIRHICHEMRNSITDSKEQLALTDQLFMLSCMGHADVRLRPAQYRLVAIINDVIRTLPAHPKITMRQVKNVTLYIDKMRLQVILRNLLTNAIRYGANNEIIIRTSVIPEFDTLSISVIDQGAGMSKEQQASLFQYMSKSTSSVGQGIGLALSNELARYLGLSISVKSTGKGSEFILEGLRPIATQFEDIATQFDGRDEDRQEGREENAVKVRSWPESLREPVPVYAYP